MARGRLHQVEVWTDPPAQAGAQPVITLTGVSDVRHSEAVNNDESCSLRVPLTSPAIPLLVERQCLVFRFAPVLDGGASTSRVFRLTATESVQSKGEQAVRLVGRGLVYDLASCGIVYAMAGGLKTPEFTDSLTPADWITTYILPALARSGYTYVVLGTVDPTQTVTMSPSHWTPLAMLEALAKATFCEFQLRDTGELDLVTAINGSLTRRALSTGRNLPRLQVTRDALAMANALVPIGRRGHDVQSRSIAHVLWKISAIDAPNLDITIVSADGGTVHKLIGFDGQYTTNSGLAANWWITSLKDRRAYQISNSYVATQKLRITSSLGQLAVGDYIELRQSAAHLTRSDWGSLGTGHYPARVSAISTNQLTLATLLSGDPIPTDDVHLGQRCEVSALQATTTCSAVADQGSGITRYTVTSTTGMLAGDWGFITSAGAEPWGVVSIFQITSIVSGTQFDARFKHSTKNDGVTAPNTAVLANCRIYRPRAGINPYVADEVASTNVVTVTSATSIAVNDVIEYFAENLGDLPIHVPAGDSIATFGIVEKPYARDDLRAECNLGLNHNPRFDQWSGASNVPPDGYVGLNVGRESLFPVGPGLIYSVNIAAGGFLTNALPIPWIPSASDRAVTLRVWVKVPNDPSWSGSLPRFEVSLSTSSGSAYAKAVVVPVGSTYGVPGEKQAAVEQGTLVEVDVTFEPIENGFGALPYVQGFYLTVQSFNVTVTCGGWDLYHSRTAPEAGYDVRYCEGNALVGETNKKLQLVHVPAAEYLAGVHDWSRLVPGDADLELMKGVPLLLDSERLLPTSQPIVRVVRIDWNESQRALTQIHVETYADRLSRILGAEAPTTGGGSGVSVSGSSGTSDPTVDTSLLYYNVKDYGAKGDGVTDDYAAIAAALTAAGSKGVIYFPAAIAYMTGTQILQPSGIYFRGDGDQLSLIRALASATMQSVVLSDTTTGVGMYDLAVDANGGARAYTGAMEAIRYQTATDYVLFGVTARGARGPSAGGSGTSLVLAGSRGTALNIRTGDSGSVARPADAVYCATNHLVAANYLCEDATDTGWAFENSQFSSLTGFAMKNVGCAFGVTSNTSSDLIGVSISDGVVEDFDTTVSGAIQLGTISTGNLLNTSVSNVTLRRASGAGPALAVRKDSTGITRGLVLHNITIDGADTQGMVLRGENIVVTNPVIRGCASYGILCLATTNVDIMGGRIDSPSVGIGVDSCVNVRIETHIVGTGGTMTQGVLVMNPCTAIDVGGQIENATVARVGATGAGPQTVRVMLRYIGERGGFVLGMDELAGMYAPDSDANMVQLIGQLRTIASTTARASLLVPVGTAPSSPVEGQLWNDGSGFFLRQGGTNKDLAAAGGGGGGGLTYAQVLGITSLGL